MFADFACARARQGWKHGAWRAAARPGLLKSRQVVQSFAAETGSRPLKPKFFQVFARGSSRHTNCMVMAENTKEATMTLTLTPSLTIRIRRAADNAQKVIRTHTRHLSITSMSFLRMEVMVFKYRAK